MPVEFVSANEFSQLTAGRQERPEADRERQAARRQGRRPKPVKELAPKVVDKPEITTDLGRGASRTQARKPETEPKPAEEDREKPKHATSQARSDRRCAEEGRGQEAAQAREEAAGVQAGSDRRGIEEGRSEETAAVQIRRQPGRRLARPPRAAAPGGEPPRRSTASPRSARRPAAPRNCRRARSMRCERGSASAGIRRPASTPIRSIYVVACASGSGRTDRLDRSSRKCSTSGDWPVVRRSPRAPSAR